MLVCLVGITWLGILGATEDVANRETTLLKKLLWIVLKRSWHFTPYLFPKNSPWHLHVTWKKNCCIIQTLSCYLLSFFSIGQNIKCHGIYIYNSEFNEDILCQSVSPLPPLWVFSSLFFNLSEFLCHAIFNHHFGPMKQSSGLSATRKVRFAYSVSRSTILQDEVAGMNFRPSNKEEFNQLRKIFHLFKLTGQVKDTFFLELIRLPCFLVFNDVG